MTLDGGFLLNQVFYICNAEVIRYLVLYSFLERKYHKDITENSDYDLSTGIDQSLKFPTAVQFVWSLITYDMNKAYISSGK